MNQLPRLLVAVIFAVTASALPRTSEVWASPAQQSEARASEAEQPSEVTLALGSEDWLIEHGRAVYDPAGLERLEVTQLWGDLRVRGGAGDEIVVTFAAQRHREDPRGVDFHTALSDAGTRTLGVGFAALEIEEVEAWQPRRIDVAIELPHGLALTVTSGADLTDVSKVDAPVDLTSTTGEIRFDGSGPLTASSRHGRVRALVRSTAERAAPLRIETLTGEITLWLLEGANAEVTIETHGTIATDYSLDIDRRPGRKHKRARALVGAGGRALELRSHEGDVSLLALGADEGAVSD